MSIKPPRLKKGEGIGIIAPAGPVTPSDIQPGIKLLESFGHRVILSSHLFQRQDYMAGDDDSRLADFHAMFRNKDAKAIFCARGGYGTLRLLDGIDFDLIRMNPKIIVGYSDITALFLAIYKKTGLVTFHGPVVKEISKGRTRDLESFFDLASSGELLQLDLSGARALVPGKASGILLGGNLSLISHLLGTPFMPSLNRSILFIEEKGEAPYRIDRMLTHLRLSGLLDNLAGLMAGRFEDCGDISTINQLLGNVVSDLNIPVVSGLPVGHSLENIALPIGLMARFDTERLTLSTMEPCVAT